MFASFKFAVVIAGNTALLAVPESAEILAVGILLIATAVLTRRLLRRMEAAKADDRSVKKV